MDKVEREKLKHDRFVEEVQHGVEFVAEHKSQVGLYTGLAVAALAIGLGVWWYMGNQKTQRMQELSDAMQAQAAPVGPAPNSYMKSFPTKEAKDVAVKQQLTTLASKYSGKDVGYAANYYLGITSLENGKTAEAEQAFQKAAEGNDDFGALAKFSLASLYARENKKADAEKLLRSLIASPTITVSKEQAEIELAKILASSNPEEAKKLLEPLRSSTSTSVSRWAVAAYGELGLSAPAKK